MSEAEKGPPRRSLSPEQLAELLKKLDAVMDDAEHLRRQVSRQLAQHRRDQHQTLSKPAAPPRRRKGR